MITDDEIMSLFAGGRYEAWANDRRDRIVAVLRGRVFTQEPVAFRDIAQHFGVTIERMRQILDQSRLRMRYSGFYGRPEFILRIIRDYPRFVEFQNLDEEFLEYFSSKGESGMEAKA